MKPSELQVSDDVRRANPHLFPPLPASQPAQRKARSPTKTELGYKRAYLETRVDVRRVVYEGLALKLENGHRYTPDWVVERGDGKIELHEVKGAYRLPSYRSARLAYDQARIEWPMFEFVWWEQKQP